MFYKLVYIIYNNKILFIIFCISLFVIIYSHLLSLLRKYNIRKYTSIRAKNMELLNLRISRFITFLIRKLIIDYNSSSIDKEFELDLILKYKKDEYKLHASVISSKVDDKKKLDCKFRVLNKYIDNEPNYFYTMDVGFINNKDSYICNPSANLGISESDILNNIKPKDMLNIDYYTYDNYLDLLKLYKFLNKSIRKHKLSVYFERLDIKTL